MRIKGTDLEQWAPHCESRGVLPELVRRLIHATIPVQALSRVDIPADEGIGLHGPDGWVVSGKGNTWVPEGRSIWEMGCGEDYSKKASDDYRERTKNPPPGVDPTQTTFVFVTPRRWSQTKLDRPGWEKPRRDRGPWKNVIVHDADALAAWLQQTVEVSVWFAEILGRVDLLHTLEWIWSEWSGATRPPSSEGLVLAGRREQSVRLLDWLRGPASVQTIYGSDPREVAAFCWATMRWLPEPERSRSRERSLVVQGEKDLRRVSAEAKLLILMAQESSLEVARAVSDRGHHVILTDGGQLRDALVLGPLDSQLAQIELQQMGYSGDAHQLVSCLRGTQPGTDGVPMVAIRRELDGRGDELAPELAPLCLVGGWTDSEEDIRIVCELIGEDDAWLRDLLRRNSGEPRSPLIHGGTGVDARWRWASRRDAWVQLEPRLSSDMLERFERVFVGVFSGDARGASEELRDGLLVGLALFATEGRRGRAAQERASSLVPCLLFPARADRWAPLVGALPTLAEVAPESFMKCTERLRPHDLARLLDDDHVATDLLAALEVLAWSEHHFLRATEFLAASAVSASTDRIRERAAEALCSIYWPWAPHTTASLADRMRRLDALAHEHPKFAVELFVDLLETSSESVRPRPVYRDWAQHQPDVSRVEANEAYAEIWERLLELARADAPRWLLLFPKLFGVAPDPQRRSNALTALVELDASQLGEDGRESLRRELRLTFRSRKVGARQWSEADLQQLQALHDRLAPDDLRDSLAFVFNVSPIFEDEQQAQREAAVRLADAYGPGELFEFASRVGSPVGLAYALASLGHADERVYELLQASLAAPHAGSQEFRIGLGRLLYERVGLAAWQREAIVALPAAAKAELLSGCASDPATWDFIEGLGPEIYEAYWLRARASYPHDREDLGRVVRSLVDVGRVRDATRLVASARVNRFGSLESELVVDLLDATLGVTDSDGMLGTTDSDDGECGVDGHLISALFDQLRAEGDRWRDQLRRYEWIALPRLNPYHGVGPRTLYEQLERNPAYLVDIVGLAYDRPTTEHEKAASKRARTLLRHWRRLPGRREDGSIDVTELRAWVREVTDGFGSANMSEHGDRLLGQVLARSPEGTDGRWPHEAVREVFEELGNAPNVRKALANARATGVSWADPEHELAVAEKLRGDANALRVRHSRTALLLEELAQRSERDADWWLDITEQRGDWTSPVTTEARVDHALDQFEADGRLVFDLDTLRAKLGNERDLSFTLDRHRRVARLAENLYTIVPYRSSGAPPPSWYLDELMRRSKTAYCVGLLSAAAIGAADQQRQVFHVLVDRQTPTASIGAHTIEFVHRSREQPFDVRRVNTQTGTMAVATVEATVFDLTEHADRCGGRDAVVAVLEQLAENVDLDALKMTASAYPPDIVATAASLLDEAGHERLAHSLRELEDVP